MWRYAAWAADAGPGWWLHVAPAATAHLPLHPTIAVELDDEICLCFHVTKRKILNFLRVQRPRRATQMSECFSAGTGCGWCRRLLVRYFEAFVRGEPADDADFSPDQYAHSRARYIRETGAQPPPGATPLPDALPDDPAGDAS